MKQFKTRAKTAYGLLSEIRRLILEEPKRYNQRDLLVIFNEDHTEMLQYGVGVTNYTDVKGNIPSCGTIGCVAGWVTVIASPNPIHERQPWAYAKKVLGLKASQSWELFKPEGAGWDEVQTPEHAQAGAAHIAAFQRKYAAQLKATKL